MFRRTRSSRPWALPLRRPWRKRVRWNTPSPPPAAASASFVGSVACRCLPCLEDITRNVAVSVCIRQCLARAIVFRCPRTQRSGAVESLFGESRMFGAPDPLAPWMAQGERSGMARACPAHRPSVTRPSTKSHAESPRKPRSDPAGRTRAAVRKHPDTRRSASRAPRRTVR